MKKNFKILIIGIVTILTILTLHSIKIANNNFFSMDALPKGELIYSLQSPDKSYTFNAYLCNGGATVDYSIRGEVVDNKTNEKKNIYWDYHVNMVKAKWKDDDTIIINEKEIEDVKNDIYDYRKDKEYDEDYNFEHFYK